MYKVTCEQGPYYVFDSGNKAFKELYRINRMESFFVDRAKIQLQVHEMKTETFTECDF